MLQISAQVKSKTKSGKETNAMRAKYWTKRMLSGVLSAVMVLSVAAGPVSALASDTKTDPKKNLEEYVSSLPDLDDAGHGHRQTL